MRLLHVNSYHGNQGTRQGNHGYLVTKGTRWNLK